MSAAPDDPTFLQRLAMLGGGLDKQLQPYGGAQNLGLSLLANSGYSQTPRSFGQTLGISALQSQQMAQEKQNEDMRKRYMEAMIQQMGRPKQQSTPFGEVNPSQYTPDSVSAFQKTLTAGNPDYSVLRGQTKEPSLTDDQREYDMAKMQGFKGSFIEFKHAQMASANPEPNRPPSGYRWKPDGTLEDVPGGPADPAAAPKKNLRPIPAAAAQGIVQNRLQIGKIDRALDALTKNPDAFGMQNYLPDFATQRLGGNAYSGGIDARAKVADIGSLVIHDRSGAAVTAAEYPRLAPFIPKATDDPDTVTTKLQNLRANLQAMQEETESIYSEDAGYRSIPSQETSKATQYTEGQTATNPKTGEKMIYRNGAWAKQ